MEAKHTEKVEASDAEREKERERGSLLFNIGFSSNNWHYNANLSDLIYIHLTACFWIAHLVKK